MLTFSSVSRRSAKVKRYRAQRQPHRKLGCEHLEARRLLTSDPFTSLPSKDGETFVVDDFDNKITRTDLGFNYFGGNTGSLNDPEPTSSAEVITSLTTSSDSFGSVGGSLKVAIDFSGQVVQEAFGGLFTSLFGLTDTKIVLEAGQVEPAESTAFPDYFLDFDNVYRDFLPLQGRSIELVAFDTRLAAGSLPFEVKVELKDENDVDVFTRVDVDSDSWSPFNLSRADFDKSLSGKVFDWNKVNLLSFIVERENVGDMVSNPDVGTFLLDNVRLIDTDGAYPALDAIEDSIGQSVLPEFEKEFLDLVRAMSSLYFLDFASTDHRTGGIIQDRSTFADLMSVGGAGFQLTSYVIDADRGYLSRADAVTRVSDILRVLNDEVGSHPMGPAVSGTIGHEGFFYHFLGIDGLRKQNFDFDETVFDESLNTVELSTIDTALAIAGVVTAGQYFDSADSSEFEIRRMANEIYSRVNWNFMLDDERFTNTNQFFLGWKPNEVRDDESGRFGRFMLDDDPVVPEGQYSSKLDAAGTEGPATLDFYTDEGLLVALLAMGSPNPVHRMNIGREVWDAIFRDRDGGSFVKTFPGSLFTYQFLSAWVDTQSLGLDSHPVTPVNFFTNTQRAIQSTVDYASVNPNEHATLDANRWGLSATEGPFDNYFAEAAPDAAIHPVNPDGTESEPMGEVFGTGGPLRLEGEAGTGHTNTPFRSNASNGMTARFNIAGQVGVLTLDDFDATAQYEVSVRYSNDGPADTLQISIDGIVIGNPLVTENTFPPGGNPGDGWNVFVTESLGSIILAPGMHEVTIDVINTDIDGVEIDYVMLEPRPVLRGLEVGTVTNYGVGSSILHAPTEAINGLWNNAQHEDLNNDGSPELLHPRFGFADAFNLDVADAVIPGAVHCSESRILRCSGPWANFTGFSIDHGPMAVMIDNYLEGNFVPKLFMSHTGVASALDLLFPKFLLALDEEAPFGSIIGGSRAHTFISDDQYEVLREELTPDGRLEHIWKFKLPPSDQVTFSIEAYTNTTSEEFFTHYSIDEGQTWKDLLTISKTSDNNQAQTLVLPDAISGSVWVRARDSDRTSDGTVDDLFVDHVGFQLVNGGGKAAVEGLGTSTVSLLGTSENDLFAFSAGEKHLVCANAECFVLDPSVVTTVEIDSAAGDDTVHLFGDGGRDVAGLRPRSVELAGTGYVARAKNSEQIRIDSGGGSDERATFRDSPGNDQFSADPQSAQLTGPGFSNEAEGFDRMLAFRNAGGDDVAEMFDSPGRDFFVSGPDFGRLGGNGFYIYAGNFGQVVAHAVNGGHDRAFMNDSSGNDSYSASPQSAQMVGSGFDNMAHGFDRTYGMATAGGDDVANLVGSDGRDYFLGMADFGRLSGALYHNRVEGFGMVNAAGGAGFDVGFLHATDGICTHNESSSHLEGGDMEYWLTEFERVYCFGAADGRARFFQLDNDDLFKGAGNLAAVFGPGRDQRAIGFGTVEAHAKPGQAPSEMIGVIDYVLERFGW